MRLVSADSSSDLSLPASVTRKRLVVSARWPISSSVAGSTKFSQTEALESSTNSLPISSGEQARR